MPKIVDHNQYRKELLQGCIPVFASNSFGLLTMRQIAKELGVTTGTLYHYFSSKEDIFYQLVEHLAKESFLQSEKHVVEYDTLEERLDSFLQFMKTYEEQAIQVVLIMTDFIRTAEAKGVSIDSNHFIDSFHHVEWTAKYLQVDDVELVRHLLHVIQGIFLHRYMEHNKSDIDIHFEMAKKMFLRELHDRSNRSNHSS